MHRVGLWPARAALLAGFIALFGGCNRNVSDKKIDFIELNRAVALYEANAEDPETALFIDSRNGERFAQGHIRGARNIRVNEIDPRYEADPELLKYDNLVVYGENPASATARAMAKQLIQTGYNTVLKRRVRVFTGGWVVWDASGLPIDRDPVPEEEGSEDGSDPQNEGSSP